MEVKFNGIVNLSDSHNFIIYVNDLLIDQSDIVLNFNDFKEINIFEVKIIFLNI